MNVPDWSAPQLPEKARSAKNPCEGKAMDLADLIEPDPVVSSNKQQLLQDLASRAATLLNLDAQTIFTAFAREELGSTGLGNRFALPHARIEGLDRLPTQSTAILSISCSSYLSRQPLTASISPPSLLSRGTCAYRKLHPTGAKPRIGRYFAHGRHAKTDLVDSHRSVPITSFARGGHPDATPAAPLSTKAPKRVAFSTFDRLVFASLYWIAPSVVNALVIVKPETVIVGIVRVFACSGDGSRDIAATGQKCRSKFAG
jgi:hypothetical protein